MVMTTKKKFPDVPAHTRCPTCGKKGNAFRRNPHTGVLICEKCTQAELDGNVAEKQQQAAEAADVIKGLTQDKVELHARLQNAEVRVVEQEKEIQRVYRENAELTKKLGQPNKG